MHRSKMMLQAYCTLMGRISITKLLAEKREHAVCAVGFVQPLSTLKEVSIVEGSRVVSSHNRNNFVMVGPYLQVTFDNGVLLATARDMESFSQTLKSSIKSSIPPPT